MGFVKTSEELARVFPETIDFYDAEMLTVIWETRPDTVRRLLPPPLKPGNRPIAVAFVANYPRTNFGVTYLESALFLRAEFEGQEGNYCLAMPVTNDIALILGREVFGYPKKMASIKLHRQGKVVEGVTERHGRRFFRLRAELGGKFNSEDAGAILADVFSPGATAVVTAYNFKYFPAPDRNGFDYAPRLIREEVVFRPRSIEIGRAEIAIEPSPFDPWFEVEVVRILGAIHMVGDNSMKKGKVVAEADPLAFAPFAFMKLDF
jgi:acetoacetate decarboxylase